MMEMVFISKRYFEPVGIIQSCALINNICVSSKEPGYLVAKWKGRVSDENHFSPEKVKKLLTIPDQIKADLILLLPRLRRFAISLTHSVPDADDLLQDACTAALAKWQQYDQSQPFDRWMFRIIRNSWISETRKRKVRQGQGQVKAEEATELTVKNKAVDTLAINDVLGHISELSEELSQPLLLVCAEGYSYTEVSELLEIPKGTVMSRIYRARQLLASKLAEEEGGAQ